jgi:hypothetical protein
MQKVKIEKAVSIVRNLAVSRAFRLYWVLVLMLTLLDLSSFLIPSKVFHLALESHSEKAGQLRNHGVPVSENFTIVNVLHTHANVRYLAADEILRFAITLSMGVMFVYLYDRKSRWSYSVLRIAWVAIGSTAFSQGVAFLLFGGVVDWLHVRTSGTRGLSLAFSDMVHIAGECVLVIGLLMLLASAGMRLIKRQWRTA